MLKPILFLLLLTSSWVAVEAAPTATNSTSRVLLLENCTMALPTAKATLIVGPLTRTNALFVGDFKLKVFPYFFKSDRGRLAINAPAAALAEFNQGKTVIITGTATSAKNGVVRQIEITATPADRDHGNVNLWFMAGKQKMIFNSVYHFAGQTVATASTPAALPSLATRLR